MASNIDRTALTFSSPSGRGDSASMSDTLRGGRPFYCIDELVHRYTVVALDLNDWDGAGVLPLAHHTQQLAAVGGAPPHVDDDHVGLALLDALPRLAAVGVLEGDQPAGLTQHRGEVNGVVLIPRHHKGAPAHGAIILPPMASFSGTQDFKGRIGEHLGYSDWLEITQERVN